MTEFALILPVFLLLVLGLLDVGRFVFESSVASQAAREGARLASVEASWLCKGPADPPCAGVQKDASCGTVGGPVCPATFAVLQAHVVTAVNRMTAPFGIVTSANVFLSCDATTPPTGQWVTEACASPNNAAGKLVSVRVVFAYAPITPLIGGIVGSHPTSGSATMVIN